MYRWECHISETQNRQVQWKDIHVQLHIIEKISYKNKFESSLDGVQGRGSLSHPNELFDKVVSIILYIFFEELNIKIEDTREGRYGEIKGRNCNFIEKVIL